MSNLPNVNTASEQQAEAWTQAAYVWILGSNQHCSGDIQKSQGGLWFFSAMIKGNAIIIISFT